ncbi:MAG: (4Fe-4S)-binding protein [Desulfuromonadaceae bacterium]
MANSKKMIRVIKIDADKCNGCRSCEIMCSAFHATPKYSSNNPTRSRIQVVTDRLGDIWYPVLAGEYTSSECSGRNKYVIDGKEYAECDSCRASCPSRDLFKEPDSGLPLKCDMCDGEEEPICVKWCLVKALTYEEREDEQDDEREEGPKLGEVEIGLQALTDRHGMKKVMDTIARLSKKV